MKVVGKKRTYIVDHVIIAAGARTYDFGVILGIHIPVMPLHGYSYTIHVNRKKEGFMDNRQLYTFVSTGDFVRIAGKADFESYADERVEELRNAVHKQWSCSEDGVFWEGHRPLTPDTVPIISPVLRNVFINTGHGPVGLTCCLSSAQLVMNWLCGIPLPTSFSCSRFQ